MLNKAGLSKTIKSVASKGKPILGICLGMQLLGRKSEEGKLTGLSLIPFDCVKFRLDDSNLKVPHMGWDVVDFQQVHSILDGLEGIQRYYFVYSYHATCDDKANILMTYDYGYEFPAAVIKGNVIGMQFHPEKSHRFGLAILSNFVSLCKGR